MQLVNIGFGNIIAANKIVAIVSPDSAPIKRMVQDAKDAGTAIDATCGRKTRAVLIMDSARTYNFSSSTARNCSRKSRQRYYSTCSDR